MKFILKLIRMHEICFCTWYRIEWSKPRCMKQTWMNDTNLKQNTQKIYVVNRKRKDNRRHLQGLFSFLLVSCLFLFYVYFYFIFFNFGFMFICVLFYFYFIFLSQAPRQPQAPPRSLFIYFGFMFIFVLCLFLFHFFLILVSCLFVF